MNYSKFKDGQQHLDSQNDIHSRAPST